MNTEKYQVKASVIESQRVINGILTLYTDRYTFNGEQKKINWKNSVCKYGVEAIKLTNTYSELAYVVFQENEKCSEKFFVADSELCNLVKKTIEFIFATKTERNDTNQQDKENTILFKMKVSEKKKRISKEVEDYSTACSAYQNSYTFPNKTVEKAAEPILHNPYRLLGISCISSTEEVNDAYEKIKN